MRKGVAAILCAVLCWQWGGAAAVAGDDREPCLLVRMSSEAVPERTAKGLMDPLPGLLLADLRVRWVAVPPSPGAADPGARFPEPDDASLRRIAAKVAEAAGRVNAMEMPEADGALREAEAEARRFRFGDSTRPYLAEIFLLRGLMRLWSGDRSGAEEALARSRALRPGFSPDPALFSPSFREIWTTVSGRPSPVAEIAVRSLPPGADILVDGVRAGTTPGRVKPPVAGPVRLTVRMPGYAPAERVGQWLPGDADIVDLSLTRDRGARLGELASSAPASGQTGELLEEMAAAAGAGRVALLVLEGGEGRSRRLRVVSLAVGEPLPTVLGTIEWPEGDGAAEVAAAAASLMISAGWPPVSAAARAGSSWYHKWWVWAALGVIVAGVAAGIGGSGGGGDSGSSTGAIGVDF